MSAPGYLDERAAPFDEAVERAVRDGDLPALAAIDPVLAADRRQVCGPFQSRGHFSAARNGRQDNCPVTIVSFSLPRAQVMEV